MTITHTHTYSLTRPASLRVSLIVMNIKKAVRLNDSIRCFNKYFITHLFIFCQNMRYIDYGMV